MKRRRPAHPIDAVIPYLGGPATARLVSGLRASGLVGTVVVLASNDDANIHDGTTIVVDTPDSVAAVTAALRAAGAPWILWLAKPRVIVPGQFALERFVTVAEATNAGLLYSDRTDVAGGVDVPHPVIDYREGSIRDDFDFGPLLLFNAAVAKEAAREIMRLKFAHAGLYALRLAVSRRRQVLRIPETLYRQEELDLRASGEKQFDYVDPRNRAFQIEMEKAATDHLKKIGAWLRPSFLPVDAGEGTFPVEATVVIPVKDRAGTIGDAIASALRQQTNAAFNVIVVDNHSTDGTGDAVKKFAAADGRVIHAVPERHDLGIGGCWNEGVRHPACGRFAVQLDSDDLYAGETTLQKIIDTFYGERCAAVVGSYRMTDFDLREVPPGVIDHREWTVDNGRNNALRINGFGAPRAYLTRIVREHPFPNVSYGEDYAVMLAVSRTYAVGRIYEPIYLCRRWKGNSDANLTVAALNAFNAYKDTIRTIEINARQSINARRS